MSKIFKIVIILLVVVSVSSAIFAVFAVMEKEKEYMKRLILEDKLAAVIKDKNNIEKDRNSIKKEKAALELQLKEMNVKVSSLSGQVENMKGRLKIASANWATRKKEVTSLKEYLGKAREKNLDISEKFKVSQTNYENARNQVIMLEESKRQLEDKLADLTGNPIDLDKIVVRPLVIDENLLKGSVIVVNKDYNFIVADLGGTDKLKEGMLFDVTDGDELLAKAEIEKIYDTMSSLAILPGGEIDSIRKGNSVIESR